MPSRPKRRSIAQDLGQHLRLVMHHGFVAGVDAVFVFILGAGPHPGGEVAGVLVEQVVDALLEAAADHRVGLRVQPRGKRFQGAAAHFRLIHLPVVPAP
jgi:hypothetical protein